MAWIERTGANEELILVLEVNQILGFIRARIPMTHANDSYVTRNGGQARCLGNLDRVLVTSGHTGAEAQTLDWYASGSTYRFTGGDDQVPGHARLHPATLG